MKKKIGLYIMAVLYIAAGVNHFIHVAMYMSIMPPWLPKPLLLVYISGACEIILGVLLFISPLRHLAAWGIILLLIAIYPANIQMTINYYRDHNPYLWLTLVRLPIQFLLIWWAYHYTKRGATYTSQG